VWAVPLFICLLVSIIIVIIIITTTIFYGAVIMTKVNARVQPVHLMNVD